MSKRNIEELTTAARGRLAAGGKRRTMRQSSADGVRVLTRLTLDVPAPLKSWLRMRAATETVASGRAVTITDLVIDALERYQKAMERKEGNS